MVKFNFKKDNNTPVTELGAADHLEQLIRGRDYLDKTTEEYDKNNSQENLFKNGSTMLRANKSANFDDFIEMVNRIIKKVLGKYKVDFSPDEGARVKVPSTETLDNPHIQFTIVERVPRSDSIKPRPRDYFEETNPNGTKGRKGIVYGQIFDYKIQFDILASDYKTANQVMILFEDAMFNYTAYIKKNGVNEIIFLKQFTDSNLDVYRNTVSVRSLQYRVSIERNRLIYDSELVEIDHFENVNSTKTKNGSVMTTLS